MLTRKKIMAMKSFRYKLFTLFSVIVITSTVSAQREVTRDFSKTFPAKPSATIKIDNTFGDVVFESWDRNETAIDVRVVVESASMEMSEKLFSSIDIQYFESDTVIGARTVIDSKFSALTKGITTKLTKFRIDYVVKMPEGYNVDVTNKFGNINMPEMAGLIRVDLKYGNLDIIKLLRGNIKPINTISVSYGNVSIGEANWLSVISRFVTDLSINKVQALTFNSRYSRLNVSSVASIVADSKYDNVIIGDAKNLVAEGSYTSYKLRNLSGVLDINIRYGNFEVLRIPAGFENITSNSSYTNIRLGIDDSAIYKLDAKVNYGSLSFCDECLDIRKTIKDNTSKEVVGVAGKTENPKANVYIRSSFGSVKLK